MDEPCPFWILLAQEWFVFSSFFVGTYIGCICVWFFLPLLTDSSGKVPPLENVLIRDGGVKIVGRSVVFPNKGNLAPRIVLKRGVLDGIFQVFVCCVFSCILYIHIYIYIFIAEK
jgi:hypothetical protein